MIHKIIAQEWFLLEILRSIDDLIVYTRDNHPTYMSMVVLVATAGDEIHTVNDYLNGYYLSAEVKGIQDPTVPDGEVFIIVSDFDVIDFNSTGPQTRKVLNVSVSNSETKHPVTPRQSVIDDSLVRLLTITKEATS